MMDYVFRLPYSVYKAAMAIAHIHKGSLKAYFQAALLFQPSNLSSSATSPAAQFSALVCTCSGV